MSSALKATIWRYSKQILATIFIFVVLIQGAFHILKTAEGRPYEGWDEMKPFNNAHVLVGPASTRTFRYGSVDTFLQWAAIIVYNNLSVTGASHSHIRYSNNVPQSWDDPFLPHKPRTWPYLNYDHFRGIDDRTPIFISRIAHLLFVYCVLLVVGLISIVRLGPRSIYIIVPGLVVTAFPDIYLQAAQSFPNAINAILTFAVVIFSTLFVAQHNATYLLLAASAFAIALNCKPDAIVVGCAILLALTLSAPATGLLAAFRTALKASLVFGFVFIATNPLFLFAPVRTLLRGYYEMLDASTNYSRGPESVFANVQLLNEFLNRNLLWESVGIALVLVSGLILSCLALACIRRTQNCFALGIGAGVTLVIWGAVVLTVNSPYDRYFINGLAALLATIAMCLLVLDHNWRRAAQVTVAVLFAIYCARAWSNARQSLATYLLYSSYEGFDPRHHRNLASLYAIKSAADNNFSRTVLVDQHAYIDLFLFRRAGMDAKYINASNIGNVVTSLPQCKEYVVVYGKGSYDLTTNPRFRKGEGQWSPDLMKAYDAYLARLSEFPVLQHYEGQAQRLLSYAPVRSNDDLTVAVLSIPCGDAL
jgi:hypothetical protein